MENRRKSAYRQKRIHHDYVLIVVSRLSNGDITKLNADDRICKVICIRPTITETHTQLSWTGNLVIIHSKTITPFADTGWN